jgi:hypothetical protein
MVASARSWVKKSFVNMPPAGPSGMSLWGGDHGIQLTKRTLQPPRSTLHVDDLPHGNGRGCGHMPTLDSYRYCAARGLRQVPKG